MNTKQIISIFLLCGFLTTNLSCQNVKKEQTNNDKEYLQGLTKASESDLSDQDIMLDGESIPGQGIGKKLMKRITKIAKENSCKRIELDSAFHRKNAHGFYKSIGYEIRAYLFSKTLN